MAVPVAGKGTAGRGAATAAAGPRPQGFRPSSRSRIRVAVGALLSLLAIGTILMLFSTADKRVPVLQLVRDVGAGQQVQPDDLRIVELSVDPSLEVVPSGDIDSVIGQFAKVHMVAGGLLQRPNLQAESLVPPGSAVVAVVVPNGAIPAGLVERSEVQLVFPTEAGSAEQPSQPISGVVVGLPGEPDTVTGDLSVSVQVAAKDAAAVARAPAVRIVLIAPKVAA